MRSQKMETLKKILIGLLIVLILIFIEFLKPLRGAELEPMFHIGGYLGYNLNNHTSNFDKLDEKYYNCCPTFKEAKGTGFAFGALLEMPINQQLFWGARLGYSELGGKFDPREFIGNTEVREKTPPYNTINITNAEVEYILDSKLAVIGLEPYVGFRAFKGLHAVAGFRFSYLMTKEFTQYEKLIRPTNVTFADGRLIRNDFYNQEIPDASAIQVHGLIGFGYDLPIGKNSFLTPELKYFIPFTNIADEDWSVSQFQLGLAAKFAVYPSEPVALRDTIISRDTSVIVQAGITTSSVRLVSSNQELKKFRNELGKVERLVIQEHYEKTIPKDENLEIRFTMFGVTKNGMRQENPLVIIEEIETEEGFPLLPYVFFPSGSSMITDTRLERITPAKTTVFKEDNLPWNTLDIYYNVLNIIGRRLTDNPKANITITGTNNNTSDEKGNLVLSLARANAIRDYFVSVWNINPSRLKVESVNLPTKPSNPIIPEGIQENSRVEISSNDKNILKPVYLREVLRESNPPQIEIYPAIQTTAGLRDYNMLISQSGKTIREYSYNDIPSKYVWNIEEEPLPTLDTQVEVKLSATDNVGQKKEAKQNISIEQKTIKTKRMQIEGDYRVERYSLILFDFDKSTILDNHKDVLDYIKSKIKPNSLVSISGYADRTGTAEYNRELARRRSEEVAKYFNLNPANVSVNPIGSDELIFDNDLPEGRSYSRTVKIEVRTPVRE